MLADMTLQNAKPVSSCKHYTACAMVYLLKLFAFTVASRSKVTDIYQRANIDRDFITCMNVSVMLYNTVLCSCSITMLKETTASTWSGEHRAFGKNICQSAVIKWQNERQPAISTWKVLKLRVAFFNVSVLRIVVG